MNESIKINWYRCKIDREVLRSLMQKSDARGFAQAVTQLALFALTGTLAYLAFVHVRSSPSPGGLGLLLLALFCHGTVGSFFGGVACHELCHKTPFATPFWNSFFLRVYAFLAWFDPVGYRASHVRHHQVTVYADHDGEIVLPNALDRHGLLFVLRSLTFNPAALGRILAFWVTAACGRLTQDAFFKAAWLRKVIPETNTETRRELVVWARIVLLGHLALAALFVATGHWFLIVLVTFGCQYCGWLVTLCGTAQHAGMSPNVPDFRLNTRTYTCGWLPAFLYWNMQYHVEHHMYPAVPFYNLPRLRSAIEHDLPRAPHGLIATWRELVPILARQRREPGYFFVPELPSNPGDRVSDELIQAEASQQTA